MQTLFSLESTVFFPETVYRVQERTEKLEVSVQRVGDLTNDLEVICYTRDGKP